MKSTLGISKESLAVDSDARKLNFGSLSPFGIRSAFSSEMKVLRLQRSKSHTSELRELVMLSTCRSLVAASLFEIYLDSFSGVTGAVGALRNLQLGATS